MSIPRERLLRLMDLNMWEMIREIARNGRDTEIFEIPNLTMVGHPDGAFFNNVVCVRGPFDVDELLELIGTFYMEREWEFSLALREHADQELEAALLERGFVVPVHEPGMVLHYDTGTTTAPPELDVRAVTDDRGRRDYLDVTADAYDTYDQERVYTADIFADLESVCSPTVQGFVGYVGERPVAAAALYLTHGVAGVGWVGTVGDQRGRGYAEALTWAVAREGFRRGAELVNLQASPMGAPVYERMGFSRETAYHLVIKEG